MKGKRILLSLTCMVLLVGIIVVIFFGELVRKNDAYKIGQTISKSSEKNLEEKEIAEEKKSDEVVAKPKERFDGLKLTKDDYGIPVLCYDSIGPSGANDTTLPQDKFKEEIKYLNDKGYTPITLTELYGYLKEDKAIPEKAVVLTFDGGNSNFYENAFPVLKEFKFLGAAFIPSDLVDSKSYLTKAQLKELSDYGIEIEGYTSKTMDLNTMKKAKDNIGSITSKSADYIAYSNISISLTMRKTMETSGYKMAFNINGTLTDKKDNIYNLDRITIGNKTSLDDFVKKLTTKTK